MAAAVVIIFDKFDYCDQECGSLLTCHSERCIHHLDASIEHSVIDFRFTQRIVIVTAFWKSIYCVNIFNNP